MEKVVDSGGGGDVGGKCWRKRRGWQRWVMMVEVEVMVEVVVEVGGDGEGGGDGGGKGDGSGEQRALIRGKEGAGVGQEPR